LTLWPPVHPLLVPPLLFQPPPSPPSLVSCRFFVFGETLVSSPSPRIHGFPPVGPPSTTVCFAFVKSTPLRGLPPPTKRSPRRGFSPNSLPMGGYGGSPLFPRTVCCATPELWQGFCLITASSLSLTQRLGLARIYPQTSCVLVYVLQAICDLAKCFVVFFFPPSSPTLIFRTPCPPVV